MMDQVWAKPWEQSGRLGDLPAGFTLPSRAAALNAIVPALRSQSGLVLVTGDAGVGKSWLHRRISAELPSHWRTVCVDPSPANDASEFYRLLGHSLGLPRARDLASSRVELADFLKENGADGIYWTLAVDEAHGLSVEVLEEIRLLSNRLGGPDGFAGLLLAGQTGLARRLASRPLAALAARVAARVHLRVLDVEETQAILGQLAPNLALAVDELEFLHRETSGNPRRIIGLGRVRLAASLTSPPPSRPVPSPTPIVAAPPRVETPRARVASEVRRSETWENPVLGEGKPPLRVEDGLIEVGWEPEAESETLASGEDASPFSGSDETPQGLAPSPLAEEAIQDRYAALQAWGEWARNQGRTAPVDTDDVAEDLADPTSETDEESAETPTEHSPIPPGVWADGQQNFAPYGQLFTRVKQRRDSN